MSEQQHHFAICVTNSGYPVSLQVRKIYEILPDEKAGLHGYVRIIDESGEDYLYPRELFIAIDLPLEVQHALHFDVAS